MPRAVDGIKQCSKCKEVKPVSEFSKDNSRADKLNYKCKKCSNKNSKQMPRVISGMKQCSKCKEVKPVSEFSKDKSKSDELTCQCKECHKQYNEENKEHIKQRGKQYYKENREDRLEYAKQYGEEHKEYKSQYNKQWREENKNRDKIDKPPEKYCSACGEIKLASEFTEDRCGRDGLMCQCKKCNSKRATKRSKQRRIDDPMWAACKDLSSNICKSLSYGKGGHSWENLVDFTFDEFVKHIESQFKPEMTWKNRGIVWETDHVVPISLFNIESYDDPEFKMCWCLVNLRPLDPFTNRSENNRFGNGEEDILEAKLILAEEAGVLEEYLEKIKDA